MKNYLLLLLGFLCFNSSFSQDYTPLYAGYQRFSGDGDQLDEIDTTGGVFTVVGSVTLTSDYGAVNGVYGLGTDPTDDQMYVLYQSGGTNARRLGALDPETGTITDIGNSGNMIDIDFGADGTLYGTTGSVFAGARDLHDIDLSTGATSYVLSHLSGDWGATIAYDPFASEMIYVCQPDHIDKINLGTLTQTSLTATTPPGEIQALVVLDENTAWAQSFNDTYVLDLTTNTYTLLNAGTGRYHAFAFGPMSCDALTTSVSSTELCEGEEVTLEATSLNGGTISWDGGVTNDTPFTPPTGTTTYTATSDNGDDCEFQVDITVNALPTVTASADDDEICDGDNVTLNGGGAATYSWDMGITDGVAFSPPVGTETYTVTGTDANGCENTASVEVTVHASPTVNASADDTEVCDGDNVTLTGGGAEFYSWTGGVIDGVAFSPPVGVNSYTVTGTDANGCENTADIDVEVYNLPTVTASADDTEICDGDNVTLNGGGAVTYNWDMGVTDGVAFAPPLGTETYTVTGIDANGCENTASIDVTVNGLPTVTASASETEICLGDDVTFTGGGAATYSWDMGVINGVAFTPVLSGLETYTVTGTDANGCENTATVDVEVYNLPTVTASADDAEVCDGDLVTLNGGGAASYTWDMGVTDGVAFAPSVGTETYTVTGIDDNGCENTASIDIIVHELPTVTATVTETEICFGESVTFTGSGASTYDWDMGVTDAIAFTPLTAGIETYTVIGTDDNGCENTAEVEVTVGNEMFISYTTVDEIFGADGEIDITVSGGAPGYTYDWDTDGAGDFDDPEDLTGLTAGFYAVVALDSDGCEISEIIEVILACTPLSVDVSDEVICENESLTLNATSMSGAAITWDGGATDGIAFFPDTVGVITYTATSEDELDCPLAVIVEVLAAPVVNPTIGGETYCDGDMVVLGAGGDADVYEWDPLDFLPPVGVTTYSLTGTNLDNGCSRTETIDVTVHELPEVTATADNDAICIGNSVVLTGGGATSYSWDPVDVTDAVPYTLELLGAQTFTVTGTDENGCENTASVEVEVVDEITIDYVVTDDFGGGEGAIDITVTGGAPTYTYDWDNDGVGDFDDTEDLTGLSVGWYHVIVQSEAGCEGNASVYVDSQLSLNEEELTMAVYPNPTLGDIFVQIKGEFEYIITTIDGKVIFSGIAFDQALISLESLTDGLYLLRVNNDNIEQTVQIVKQ